MFYIQLLWLVEVIPGKSNAIPLDKCLLLLFVSHNSNLGFNVSLEITHFSDNIITLTTYKFQIFMARFNVCMGNPSLFSFIIQLITDIFENYMNIFNVSIEISTHCYFMITLITVTCQTIIDRVEVSLEITCLYGFKITLIAGTFLTSCLDILYLFQLDLV